MTKFYYLDLRNGEEMLATSIFLFFPQCFQKASSTDNSVKSHILRAKSLKTWQRLHFLQPRTVFTNHSEEASQSYSSKFSKLGSNRTCDWLNCLANQELCYF